MYLSVSRLGNATQQVGYHPQIRRVVARVERHGTSENLIELRIGETERRHGEGSCWNRSTVAQELTRRSTVVSFYSWLPGTGLNRMSRNATPSGFVFAASMVIAVQMMLIEVAAIAVVP